MNYANSTVKIEAATRLRASLDAQIEDIRNRLAIDGYCIQHSNQSITFQFYVHPAPSYIKALDKTYGPHKEGHGNGETIYRWLLPSGDIGLNYYLPKDTNKAARIQLYNRSEAHASTIIAYDNTWIKKMEQRREAHPKYQGQQKPAQFEEHIFTQEPSALAQHLHNIYKDDFKSAMQSLTMYKNRMGKNLLSPDRDRIDKAKEQLRKRYGKDENSSSTTTPSTKHSVSRKPANERQPIGSRPTTRTV